MPTAASAYRAAEFVRDHTTGQLFDYSCKRGVEHAEIVLPTAAARRDINWARDREALWNAAERAENRSNCRSLGSTNSRCRTSSRRPSGSSSCAPARNDPGDRAGRPRREGDDRMVGHQPP